MTNLSWDSPTVQQSLSLFAKKLIDNFSLSPEDENELLLASYRASLSWEPTGGCELTSWCFKKMQYQARELLRKTRNTYKRQQLEQDAWKILHTTVSLEYENYCEEIEEDIGEPLPIQQPVIFHRAVDPPALLKRENQLDLWEGA